MSLFTGQSMFIFLYIQVSDVLIASTSRPLYQITVGYCIDHRFPEFKGSYFSCMLKLIQFFTCQCFHVYQISEVASKSWAMPYSIIDVC